MLIIVSALCLAVVLMCLFRHIAPQVELIAHAGEHRHHETPTPVVGGIAMFFALFIGLIIFSNDTINWQLIAHYLVGAGLLVVVGALDDRFHLPFLIRFVAQVIAVLIMVRYGNTLQSLGELFNPQTLLLGKWAVLMTIFAAVGVINSLNMSDGIDGLAGSFSLVAFIMLSAFQFDKTQALLIYLWIGVLIGFLIFNIRSSRPARVFMGDAGSTLLGYTLAWLFIYGSQQAVETIAIPRLFAPIFAVWVLALPLHETVSLMLLRLAEGESPFHADRGHMHHHLLNKFGSVNKALAILLLWFSTYAVLGYCLHHYKVAAYNQTFLFIGCFMLHFIVQYKLRQKISNKHIV